MKVLSVSTDRKIFEQGSAVRSRLLGYGGLVEELHVIVFAKGSLSLREEKINPNIFLYPTNSWVNILYVFSATMKAWKLKSRGVKIDVVTSQDPFEVGIAAILIAYIFRARLHIQIHTDLGSPYFAKESLLNRVRVLIAKILLPHAHSVHVVSERIKKSIEHLVSPGVPIAVLPLFVPLRQYDAHHENLKTRYPQFSKHILVASRLSPEKNISLAIRAMSHIAAKYPHTGMIIVGSGPEEGRLKNLVANLNLSKNVLFEGWNNNLAPYYASADLFLLTSFYEGFAMTVIEALHEQCPVIMTDVGCAGEDLIHGKNGLVVPVGDQGALERGIARVISGGVVFDMSNPPSQTQENYLAQYKASWEAALAKR